MGACSKSHGHTPDRIHEGKTQVWNSGGKRPEFCVSLKSQIQKLECGEMPISEQGIRVLGTPLGHKNFVEAHFRAFLQDDQLLLDVRPIGSRVQKGAVGD